jgi:hypothetical protein
LTNAFAVVRLAAIQEFHLSRRSTNVPEPSLLIITSGRPETNKRRREALFHYSMHRDPQACQACLEHSPFLKVNATGRLATAGGPGRGTTGRPARRRPAAAAGRPASRSPAPARTETVPRPRRHRPELKSNYELFNRSNVNIRYWSWSYRGCWHQTCPPMGPRQRGLTSSHSGSGDNNVPSRYLSSLPPRAGSG